jgi:hypothetical protein
MYRYGIVFAISFCLTNALFIGCGGAETEVCAPLGSDGGQAADSSIGDGQ